MSCISVIVPVYKVEPYLDCCVKSILNQTFRDYELILVDDGSPDNCGAMCDAWASKDNRVRVIHKTNGGLSSARNAGLDWVEKNSNSQYVTFIDSDDCIHIQYLKTLYKLIQKYDADIAWCHYDFFHQEGVWFKDPAGMGTLEFYTGQELLESFTEHCRKVSLRSQCMKLYKKEIFTGLRMREGYVQEDSMVLPYVLERTGRIVRTRDQLYHWRVNPESISRSAFSERDFDYIELSKVWADFFRKRGSIHTNTFRREFLQKTLFYYYKVCDEKPALMKAYRFHIKRFRRLFPYYIWAKGMYTKERIAYILFFFAPKMARTFYNQVYGEGSA